VLKLLTRIGARVLFVCLSTPSAGLACGRVGLDLVWSARAMASKACVFVPLVRRSTGLLGPLAWILVPAGWCPLSNSRPRQVPPCDPRVPISP